MDQGSGTALDVDDIVSDAKFGMAQQYLCDNHDQFVDDIIHITEIPAPPFHEEKRAKAYEKLFHEVGLQDVERDEVGNVIGFRRGRANGRAVVLAAHLDTVFPAGTDCTVRREGTKLFAPGVGDDSRGLAALLSYARALDAAGITTDADLMFVGDVGEEGKGDLRGIRHLFNEGAHRNRIEAFFTIDGLEMDDITTTAIGSHRYKVSFQGPGGHTFKDHGTANPSYALGQLLTLMTGLKVDPQCQSTYSASVLGGGTSINAIPEDAWLEIDIRSASQADIERLDRELQSLVARAEAAENTRLEVKIGSITSRIERIGSRPAGNTDPSSAIVVATRSALRRFGFKAEMTASSTDANIPMSLGIPAIRLGSGGTGGRAHTLDEWIDVAPDLSARGLVAGLVAILGTAGMLIGD